jgi:putative serine protease PepD
MPSVVQINGSGSLGSGIILDTKGDIVTNAHVVAGGTKFTVMLSTQSQTYDATIATPSRRVTSR